MLRSLILLLTLITQFVDQSQGIRCYECVSANNSMCVDPSSYDPETLQNYLRITECDRGVYSPNHREFFCRKIVQTIIHKGMDAELRVTRGCGWVRSHRDCYKADNEDHLETVCQCFEDGCNGGHFLKHNRFVVLSLGSAYIFKMLVL